MAVELFISYASADRELQDELAKHLSGLRNRGIIKDWFNGDIVEGKEWKQELLHHLNTAQIILLLVSADFIASRFCYQIEMQRALKRHNAGLACVIPIILHPTDWKQLPFGKLQALPADAKPVSMWTNRHEAFLSIVEGIKRAIRDLQKDTSQPEDTVLHVSHEEANNQETPVIVQPAPSAARTVRNYIGSIKGRGHSINQSGTQYSTTNYYSDSLSVANNVVPAVSLPSFKALVDEMKTILASQPLTEQGFPLGSNPHIDLKREVLMNMILAIKQQSVSLPEPLLEDVYRLCQLLHIDLLV